jgi:hypothetical protein
MIMESLVATKEYQTVPGAVPDQQEGTDKPASLVEHQLLSTTHPPFTGMGVAPHGSSLLLRSRIPTQKLFEVQFLLCILM